MTGSRSAWPSLAFQRIGTAAPDAADQAAASCLLRVVVTDPEDGRVGRAFCAPRAGAVQHPGLLTTGLPGKATAYARYWPASIDQQALHHVVVHADGAREPIAPSSDVTAPTRERPAPPAGTDSADDGPTLRGPLGPPAAARDGRARR